MHAEIDLTIAAVLRRNAHELRNKLSALISAVDVMGSSPAMFAEALELLNESSADLRELADHWTDSARGLFDQERGDAGCVELARILGSALGDVPVTAAGDATVRIDRRLLEALGRRLGEVIRPASVDIRQELRYGLSFVMIAFETSSDRARLAEAEPIRSMLDQLGAQARIESDRLVLQMPATRAIRAAS